MENTKGKEKVREEFPLDLQGEVMSWLPKKSLMRFCCVSKYWSSRICEEEFKVSHYKRSNTRPRALFVFSRNELGPTRNLLFHSVYQEEEPLLVSGQQQIQITYEPIFEISAPIRGLICLLSITRVVICNPGIQKVLILPEYKEFFGKSFFGYDEDMNVFKVLCATYGATGLQFQVYKIGSSEESWKPVICNNPHFAITNSLCKEGVVYYGACEGPNDKMVLMSFNVGSEEFNVFDLPRGVEIKLNAKLVNFNGYIALVDHEKLSCEGVLQMWVWNDTKREWWSQEIVIRRWKETVKKMLFSFVGTVGIGELVFAQNGLLDDGKSFNVLYYDTVTKKFREFKIEGGAEGGPYHFVRTFLNHVDSSSLYK